MYAGELDSLTYFKNRNLVFFFIFSFYVFSIMRIHNSKNMSKKFDGGWNGWEFLHQKYIS